MAPDGHAAIGAAARAQRALARSSVFSVIPRGDLEALASLMRVESFPLDAIVMEAGDVADCVYVVDEGTLSVTIPGSTTAVRLLREGDVLGEYGFLAGSVRTATVRADEPSVLLSLEYDRFREFLLRFPQALWVIFESTARRLLEAERRVTGSK